MKNIQHFAIVIFLGLLLSTSCNRSNSRQIPSSPEKLLLVQYNKQTSFTNPGEFAYMFDEIPKSTKEICNVIKKQLIHPMEAAEIPDIFPKDKLPEDGDFPNVTDMLRELVTRNNLGLTMDRLPEDRLLVACYHHGLLLASMLKYKGKSVRLRAGFARYFEKQMNIRFSHVVCEVWDGDKEQWIIIDPDRNLQNVSKDKFEFPAEVWINYMNEDLPKTRYLGSIGQGENVYIHSLLLDMAFVLGNERNYWHTPEFIFKKDFNINNLEEKQIKVLNQIAEYMIEPEANISRLQKLYNDNPFIHEHRRSINSYYELIDE